MRLAARAGMRKAKVALARKLEEGDEDVRLNACLNLVKDRPDRQVALEVLERLFDRHQQQIMAPQH